MIYHKKESREIENLAYGKNQRPSSENVVFFEGLKDERSIDKHRYDWSDTESSVPANLVEFHNHSSSVAWSIVFWKHLAWKDQKYKLRALDSELDPNQAQTGCIDNVWYCRRIQQKEIGANETELKGEQSDLKFSFFSCQEIDALVGSVSHNFKFSRTNSPEKEKYYECDESEDHHEWLTDEPSLEKLKF